MQKTKSKIITVLMLTAITLALFPLSAVNASTGFIIVIPPTSVPAGGPIALDFTGVTWSGSQFYLYLSTDGLSQISANDVRFTPAFSLAQLQSNYTVVTDTTTFIGTWTLSNNTITGTIPRNIAGGSYYIKAYDGLTTALAVTSPAFTVTAAFAVTPTTGGAGRSLTLQGNAFPANALINLTYTMTTPQVIANLVAADAIGNLTYVIPAPDWKLAGAAGLNSPVPTNTVTFTATVNATATSYTTAYTESYRGIKQFGRVGDSVQNTTSTQIFGNNTSFSSNLGLSTGANVVTAGVGNSLWIAGSFFYPGVATLKWDNGVVLASPTVGATGSFNITSGLTVPVTPVGPHNITIVDANNQIFVIFLDVVPSVSLNPISGPVGTTVVATLYGFPASTTGTAINATIAWPAVTAYRGSAIVDSSGSATITFTVPATIGGDNNVTASQNFTGAQVVTAWAIFTVTANFAVTPSSFANNASLLVVASGAGFISGSVYQVNIDNQLFGFAPIGTTFQTGIMPSSTGSITFSFVGAGFAVGSHVVSLYLEGTAVPAAYAGFNVTSDPVGTSTMLDAINSTVTAINTKVTSINSTVIAIQTTVGGLATTGSVTALGGQLTAIQNSIAAISIPNMGSITTSLASISATLGTVSGDTAVIRTTIGELTTSLAAINTIVTRIDGNTATLSTDLGTLTGTVTSISGNVATIQTGIGTLTTDISGLQTGMTAVQSDVSSSKAATDSLSPLVIVAIVLALIAALAAIASIVLMRRKIAG